MEQMPRTFRLARQPRIRLSIFSDSLRSLPNNLSILLFKVKCIGATTDMSVHEKNKLGIFNHLNFFQFITGIIVPAIGLYHAHKFPASGWLLVCLPAFISIAVLLLNAFHRHQIALLVYFLVYPFFICFTYMNGINLGVELSFILYGILSVFFIQDIGYMIFSVSFSMISYFVLSVIWKIYPYQLEQSNYIAYLINQALAIIYIFYGLYLVKSENGSYNTALQQTNLEIQSQASQLQEQARELEQLNSLKNKLFSVIAHDLKAPMYALRNLFDNMGVEKMPAKNLRAFIPDIKKDLNHTVSLMENLLQWAKTQMQAHTVRAEAVNVNEVIDEVVQLLHLQSAAKKITVENRSTGPVSAWADRDMINLVLRNLVSNAVKFTPAGGHIFIGAHVIASVAEIYVEDSGAGISPAEMKKINGGEFYSTYGTAQEQGTGLGLMLCKEFLAKNDGQMHIETEEGRGSVFSFALPRAY